MSKIINKNLSLLTFLLVPLLFFSNPKFINLMGVQPHWSIFWLFSWGSIYGSFNGFLTGLALGIVLDSLNYDFYTQIPGFIICGILFGRLNGYKLASLNKFKYGLICSLGSLICNLLYFVQIIFHNFENINLVLVSNAIKTIFAQVFMTGIFAPIICTWLLAIFNKNNLQNRSRFLD